MMKSGWYEAEGSAFYLNDNGAGVVKCWRLGKDGKYRLSQSRRDNGGQRVDYRLRYDLLPGGRRQKIYRFPDDDGVDYQLTKTVVLIGGLIGLQYISGKAYIFDENGHMQRSGWYTANGDLFLPE